MKIRVGNWRIDVRSLVRLEWNHYYPKLVVHEKFEKHVKWILRFLTFIGIGTSFLVLPYVWGIVITLLLFSIEQIFERSVFEYSVMVILPPPDFEIDYNQWITNGYLLKSESDERSKDHLNYFGPTYKDEEYARPFFEYLRSWNKGLDTDEDNNICISFIIESDVSYSTYFYTNENRKWLNPMFEKHQEDLKLEKYGKRQQSMFMQWVFWKNLKMEKGMFFTKFLEQQKPDEKFYFAPFVLQDGYLRVLDDLKVLKMGYKLKGRSDLNKSEIEFYNE